MKRSIYFQYILFVVFVIGASFSQPSKLIEKSKKVIYKSYDKKSFELGKIDFSSLDYEFQYHAPSHMAGNNLPGFSAILH